MYHHGGDKFDKELLWCSVIKSKISLETEKIEKIRTVKTTKKHRQKYKTKYDFV